MKFFVKILKPKFLLSGLLILLIISCHKESQVTDRKLTIVFYNTENLFDTRNEPGKNDGEFTPEGSKKWTTERYQKKIRDIARVLSSVDSTDLPEIIGMCEIENDKVLDDLTRTGFLKRGHYRIVHYESPDYRGIDNALLYRPDEFSVITSSPIRVSFKNDPGFVTRDILYVKGKVPDGEVLNIFVNHWPSRIGGDKETEPERIGVAAILRKKVDSLVVADKDPEIIILGDMNDEPVNISLVNTLGAKDPQTDPQAFLQNLMFPLKKQGLGSYNYQNRWNMLDNMIVSRNLLDDNGFRCVEKQGHIFHQAWMEFKNRNGSMTPNRTYGGNNYYGGVSDHFPVYFTLEL